MSISDGGIENKAVSDSAPRMGRPPLGVKPTTVRLPVETFDRIAVVAGKHRVASFIREAVEAELARREKSSG